MVQVGMNEFKCLPGLINKDSLLRSPAQCFDAQGAGACVQVKYRAVGNFRGQDIEQGLPCPVAGWTYGRVAGFRAEKVMPSGSTAGNSHVF